MKVKELLDRFNVYFHIIQYYNRNTKEITIFENQENNAMVVTSSFIAVHGDEKVADWRCNIDEEDSLEILIEVEE